MSTDSGDESRTKNDFSFKQNDNTCTLSGSSSNYKTKRNMNDDRKFKKGIVYLSFIPPGMSVQILSQLLSQYGEIGRIMLQPAKTGDSGKKRKNKRNRNFTEGWVEFLKKKAAKQVAGALNNTQIGGKKKSQFHDYIWSMKYLSRFKWVHLSERISYERAVYKQRMQTEINQAKKVASHFKDKVEAAEKQEYITKRKKKTDIPEGNSAAVETDWLLSTYFKQRETDEEKMAKRMKKHNKNENRETFLKNLFT